MRFDAKINDIIFRYHLDADYPVYRMKVIAERYLKEWILQWIETVTADRKILCVAAEADQIMHMRFYTRDHEKFEYVLFENLKKEDEGLRDWTAYSYIFLISYQENEEISAWFQDKGLPFGSIYEMFERVGLCFQREWYVFFEERKAAVAPDAYGANNSYFLETHFLKKGMEDEKKETDYLKRLIFVSLVYKDFLSFEAYLSQLLALSRADEKQKYTALYQEIKSLLGELEEAIAKRNKQDIFMLWMDQLGYENADVMPYIDTAMRQGVFFENAFTLIPWTVPTYRCIFTDKKEMSCSMHNHDNPITKDECSICAYMQEKGYDFRVVSEHFVRKSYIDKQWGWGDYLEPHAPMSLVLWNAACCMGESDKPVFVLAHELCHTHDPWQTTKFEEGILGNIQKRYLYARQEADRQIEYYVRFMKKSVKIYMSDHGWGEPWRHTHAVLAIVSENLKPAKIKQMFPYRHFSKLIRQLLDHSFDASKLVTDYAEIFCFPTYNKTLVKNELEKKKLSMDLIGYQGVVTQEHIYLKYNNGREVLLNRNRLPRKLYVLPHKSDICDASLLPWYRQRLGKLTLDLSDKKLVWARKTLAIAGKLERAERNQLDCINKWISDSGLQRIAMRMGGEHSYTLYEWLTEENQKRVIGFIDNNPECVCNLFGKKVMRLEEVKSLGIEGVILSSFEHLEMLRNERDLYPVGITFFDIYEYLQKEGFPNKDIQNDLVGLQDSDYEVEWEAEETNR